MSALSYLCEYESNSEDSDCDNKNTSDVKKIKLHVPDLSDIVVAPRDTYKDNPEVHGYRIRSFPHERGNWASFVYVKYPDVEFFNILIDKLQKELCCIEESWQPCEDIHISLSKTFILKYHLITPFTSSLQKIVSDTDCFDLAFDALKVYCNEEKTRTFVALEVDYFCNKHLTKLSQKIDEVLKEYKLPKFHDSPSFHASLLWINGNKKTELKNNLENLNIILKQHLHEYSKTTCISRVNCKIGNKYFQYSFQ